MATAEELNSLALQVAKQIDKITSGGMYVVILIHNAGVALQTNLTPESAFVALRDMAVAVNEEITKTIPATDPRHIQ